MSWSAKKRASWRSVFDTVRRVQLVDRRDQGVLALRFSLVARKAVNVAERRYVLRQRLAGGRRRVEIDRAIIVAIRRGEAGVRGDGVDVARERIERRWRTRCERQMCRPG